MNPTSIPWSIYKSRHQEPRQYETSLITTQITPHQTVWLHKVKVARAMAKKVRHPTAFHTSSSQQQLHQVDRMEQAINEGNVKEAPVLTMVWAAAYGWGRGGDTTDFWSQVQQLYTKSKLDLSRQRLLRFQLRSTFEIVLVFFTLFFPAPLLFSFRFFHVVPCFVFTFHHPSILRSLSVFSRTYYLLCF